MTVRELYRVLNERIPKALSRDWDNDGAMCVPDGDREVRRVLITLDVTEAAVNRAVEVSADLILSHHPMIFKGLKQVNEENAIARKTLTLIRSGISVLSFHTRLDAVSGGVNDTLASLLGLSEIEPFGAEQMGRIGNLPESMSAEAFAQQVKETLGAPTVLLSDSGRAVRRVALLGGEGEDSIGEAACAGADLYLSGRLGYHPMTDAPEGGMSMIEAGHFYTEYPVCETLRSFLLEIDPTVQADIFNSNVIRSV